MAFLELLEWISFAHSWSLFSHHWLLPELLCCPDHPLSGPHHQRVSSSGCPYLFDIIRMIADRSSNKLPCTCWIAYPVNCLCHCLIHLNCYCFHKKISVWQSLVSTWQHWTEKAENKKWFLLFKELQSKMVKLLVDVCVNHATKCMHILWKLL